MKLPIRQLAFKPHLLAGILFATAFTSATASSLVVNGDFESPTTAAASCFVSGTVGSWTTSGGSLGSCYISSAYGGVWPAAFSGDQFMYINNGPRAGISVIQDVALTAGQGYKLSFAMAGLLTSTSTNQLQVGIGSQVASFSSLAGKQWEARSWEFVAATTGPTALRFTAPTANGINVDAVVLTAVPEPTSYALLLAGLAGIGLVRIRRAA